MKHVKCYLFLLFSGVCSSLLAQNNTLGIYGNAFLPGQDLKRPDGNMEVALSFEFISEDLVAKKNLPLHVYLGGGVDVNFTGSKKVDSVVFRSPNNDKGYVTLSNNVVRSLGESSHWITVGNREPYFDAHVAARGFGNELTNTFYRTPVGYNSSSSSSGQTISRGMWGAALGIMYVFKSGFRFDLRYSYAQSKGFNSADIRTLKSDVTQSTPISYTKTSIALTEIGMIRIGFMIPLMNKRRRRRQYQQQQIMQNGIRNHTTIMEVDTHLIITGSRPR
jgi:hypothetical protein